MDDEGKIRQSLNETLIGYLDSWGLREFHDEASYYQWQQASLSQQDIRDLQLLVEQRQGGEDALADIRFYDLLAQPSLLPILYSQRFDYFLQLGLLLLPRLSSAEHVLDFGCGVGILTLLYAQHNPTIQFTGIDRSVRSIEVARCEAEKRKISNVKFEVIPPSGFAISGFYDCILSTQALFQSEQSAGLPSKNWRTFERTTDPALQEHLEVRTGLHMRLDALLKVLSPRGRLLCFEKTWNLGRRILFQRALSTRGLFPLCEPVSCAYHELGEMKSDGPVYEVSRVPLTDPLLWDEAPYPCDGETLYRCVGTRAKHMAVALGMSRSQSEVRGQHATLGRWTFRLGVWEHVLAWGWCETASGFHGVVLGSVQEQHLLLQLVKNISLLSDLEFEECVQDCWGTVLDVRQNDSMPGYENHFPSAQVIYQALPSKMIQREATFADDEGKEMHIEIGTTMILTYFYWANTFDQRQLVLMDEKGAPTLCQYYQESLDEAHRSSQEILPAP
ncbi:MAG: methyltransferase domain-containing protein [Nitrospirota bacterium]|nr:methyltransferase domain-containing protein [Nitrospirota bacterium]